MQEIEQEITTKLSDTAVSLTNDIKEALKKITHHSKRANSIVKGMLQHSRGSSGKKELTDLNTLVEEYLMLTYHGLKAKNKSFNAGIQLDEDPAIETIELIPQDIARVLMNLFTNAFYSVNTKKHLAGDDYEPLVCVSTKHIVLEQVVALKFV